MFSHNEILINPKSYGLVHYVSVKKICVCCTVFADALIVVRSTTSYHCISCSFPNDLTNVIIYPKNKILFWKAGIYFAQVNYCNYSYNYFNAWNLPTTVLIYAAPIDFFFLHNPHAISMQFHT